jgi:hypothetical protein
MQSVQRIFRNLATNKVVVTWVCIGFLLIVPITAFVGMPPDQQSLTSAAAPIWRLATEQFHALVLAAIAGADIATGSLEIAVKHLKMYGCMMAVLGVGMVLVQIYRAIRDIRSAKGHLATASACAVIAVLYYTAHTVDLIS